jgi:hypothetical protein
VSHYRADGHSVFDGPRRLAVCDTTEDARAIVAVLDATPALLEALEAWFAEHEDGAWRWDHRRDDSPRFPALARAALSLARGERTDNLDIGSRIEVDFD